FALTRRLYEKGFNKEEINNIYKFIDWLIGLPNPLEIEYLEEVCELEEAKKMTYITSAERIGIEKGREEAAFKIAKLLLREGCEIALIERTTGISLAQIKALEQKLNETERLPEQF
ncbi:MAG TPA: hypothetical protein VLI69_03665, partial [Gammaproteobacteria bacterium]|nr:hypothetical protein [Gammaproteobacteria bacterium]